MKTIKRGDEIKRVDDATAHNMTQAGWEYCPKHEWKVLKPTKKSTKDLETEDISDNLSDKKKRKLRKENKRKKYETK